MKTIEITVSPTGEVQAETKGFAGASCLKATEALIKAMGVATSDKKTPEYHLTDETQQHVGE